MPQPRRRKAEPEPEEPEAREEDAPDEEVDEPVDEEVDEEMELESSGSNGLNIDVADDRVIIELPRNGNERPTLQAIGAMLESMG
jgi:hypothetical protein